MHLAPLTSQHAQKLIYMLTTKDSCAAHGSLQSTPELELLLFTL